MNLKYKRITWSVRDNIDTTTFEDIKLVASLSIQHDVHSAITFNVLPGMEHWMHTLVPYGLLIGTMFISVG